MFVGLQTYDRNRRSYLQMDRYPIDKFAYGMGPLVVFHGYIDIQGFMAKPDQRYVENWQTCILYPPPSLLSA